MTKLLSEEMEHRVNSHFKEVLARKIFNKNEVGAGRAFVKTTDGQSRTWTFSRR